ncbi:hypothetical protein M408DRAFT_172821 [Serendipita vermifera MAFF 305830]|uniref:F-box domain-containing protein n=1 Tax=Serendipita vermifera MAFF 305830 TaxID=933852 RepID=A0A0C3B4A5_SERVB|nr:hypothetical protein M408DRAFT_172821 [Serendipita vermifera MAFF 305830]
MFTPPNRYLSPGTSLSSAIPSPIEDHKRALCPDSFLPEVHKRLVKELESKKVSFPIEKLSFDPLSLMFEFCAEAEWQAPLRIGAVCKTWRQTVIESPRAWCSVDVRRGDAACLLSLYSSRCGQRPLHVAAHGDALQKIKAQRPDYSAFQQFAIEAAMRNGPDADLAAAYQPTEWIARKIRCMSLSNLLSTRHVIAYPSLNRLRITRVKPDVQLSDIGCQRFPALRHLETVGALYHDEDDPLPEPSQLPLLETLKVTANHNLAWVALVKHCSESLVSLSIIIRGQNYPVEDVSEICFPQLQCLQITTTGTGAERSWRLTFKTPCLVSYIEINESGPVDQLLHDDVSSITHLRLNQSKLPTNAQLPELRILQLEATAQPFGEITPSLESHAIKRLERVEVRIHDPVPVHSSDIGLSLDEQHKGTGLSWEFCLTAEKWSSDLPGAIPYSCGLGMSCSPDI